MVQIHLPGDGSLNLPDLIRVVRHSQVKKKLQVSSSKLYDMVARGQFPKPFSLVPNGRSVGWIERDIDQWILERKKLADKGGAA